MAPDPNFARFRQERIQPLAERLLEDGELRDVIFPRANHELAVALSRIGRVAAGEGIRYDGFWGWQHTAVGDFIERNLPESGA